VSHRWPLPSAKGTILLVPRRTSNRNPDQPRASSSAIDFRRATPFVWRIFLVNAAILTIATAALALSPATVSFPIALAEGLVLAIGLLAILMLNLVLLRRLFAPLERLTRLMRDVDLLRPGQRLEASGPQEVRELGGVFNEMLDRLERERHESGWDALTRQEAERKRVAQELHDEVGQALTAVMLQIGQLARSAPAELNADLQEALETTRASLDDVRRIAKQLRPEALDDLGLVPALGALVATFADRTGLRIAHRLDTVPELDDEAELVVFRVAQESLTNAARHAQTSRIDVTLDCDARDLVLRVRDFGRGVDGATPGGGIRGMRERALLIGADLSILTQKDGGTEVKLAVPHGRSPGR
jgi:two-component system, NarL family, sensor histidine kinase UhpB